MPGLDAAPEGSEELSTNLEDLTDEGHVDAGEQVGEGLTDAEGEEGATVEDDGAIPVEGQAPAEPPPPPVDEDEIEISFGDEAAPARGENSDLVKHLRSQLDEQRRELAALRKVQSTPAVPELGPKPTLETCEYDGEKFEAELDAWKERKRASDDAAAQTQRTAQAEQERFQQRLQQYGAGKDALKAKDYDAAEAAVLAGFSQVQQAITIKAAGDAAKLVYALGRHPQKLAELAKIQDPIEFTAALVKLEGTLKVTQRRTPPEPDTPPRGSAPTVRGVDPALERLEREAARTGDRTAIVRYRREQREKAQRK